MKKWKFVNHTNLVAQRSLVSWFSVLASESTWYFVLGTMNSCYLILITCPPRRVMLNIERGLENEEVEIREPYEFRSKMQ